MSTIKFAVCGADVEYELDDNAKREELRINGEIAMMRDVFPQAHRLAMELECLLLSCTDTAATAKWWDSANEALEQWREFCREDDTTHNA